MTISQKSAGKEAKMRANESKEQQLGQTVNGRPKDEALLVLALKKAQSKQPSGRCDEIMQNYMHKKFGGGSRTREAVLEENLKEFINLPTFMDSLDLIQTISQNVCPSQQQARFNLIDLSKEIRYGQPQEAWKQAGRSLAINKSQNLGLKERTRWNQALEHDSTLIHSLRPKFSEGHLSSRNHLRNIYLSLYDNLESETPSDAKGFSSLTERRSQTSETQPMTLSILDKAKLHQEHYKSSISEPISEQSVKTFRSAAEKILESVKRHSTIQYIAERDETSKTKAIQSLANQIRQLSLSNTESQVSNEAKQREAFLSHNENFEADYLNGIQGDYDNQTADIPIRDDKNLKNRPNQGARLSKAPEMRKTNQLTDEGGINDIHAHLPVEDAQPSSIDQTSSGREAQHKANLPTRPRSKYEAISENATANIGDTRNEHQDYNTKISGGGPYNDNKNDGEERPHGRKTISHKEILNDFLISLDDWILDSRKQKNSLYTQLRRDQQQVRAVEKLHQRQVKFDIRDVSEENKPDWEKVVHDGISKGVLNTILDDD